MLILIVAALLVALVAAAALPLIILWACSETREGDTLPRRPLFRVSFLRNVVRGNQPLQLTYRRDDRGRFRKIARG